MTESMKFIAFDVDRCSDWGNLLNLKIFSVIKQGSQWILKKEISYVMVLLYPNSDRSKRIIAFMF